MEKNLEENECRYCEGSGEQPCYDCGGKGFKMIYKNPLPNVFAFITYSFQEASSCYNCHGTGKEPCKYCKGTGIAI